jgi:hypothetical protein
VGAFNHGETRNNQLFWAPIARKTKSYAFVGSVHKVGTPLNIIMMQSVKL